MGSKRNASVLLVVSDVHVRTMLLRVLRGRAYDVHAVSTLKLDTRHIGYDVLVIDVDDARLLQQVRNIAADGPNAHMLIILNSPYDVAAEIGLRGLEFLTKPFPLQHFYAALEKLAKTEA